MVGIERREHSMVHVSVLGATGDVEKIDKIQSLVDKYVEVDRLLAKL